MPVSHVVRGGTLSIRSIVTIAAGAVLCGAWLPVHGATVSYGFGCITGSSAANCAAGAAQLQVAASAVPGSPDRVRFTFTNSGPAASSITGVYFDDGTLLGIAAIFNGAGVAFSQGASPPNLPGANLASPPFRTTAGFLADSDPPVQPNGVNPGESLAILFALISGQTYTDTLAALQGGALRIGVHVQGFQGGGSESFVNAPAPVPLPAAAWLLLAGGALVAGTARRGTRRRC
jgi:hypothetical protein